MEKNGDDLLLSHISKKLVAFEVDIVVAEQRLGGKLVEKIEDESHELDF
jgi:hypothetical protein